MSQINSKRRLMDEANTCKVTNSQTSTKEKLPFYYAQRFRDSMEVSNVNRIGYSIMEGWCKT